MNAGIVLLTLAYVLSQFFRAFLAVLAPALARDIGAGPEALAFASGLWFLAFAAFQIPVGWALDTHGPRRTVASLLLIGGGGGAAVFAMATGPGAVNAAMLLIGMGCAPVLMASYYIFARDHPPARFAVLASLMVGVGSLGNLVASWPLAVAVEAFGWRAAMMGLAAVTALTAAALWAVVRDPVKPPDEPKGSLADVLRIRALWLILPLMTVGYAQVGALRGLWIGPYLADVFGADTQSIGRASLAMGLAMIAGTLIYGPLDRVLRARKRMILAGSILTCIALILLAGMPGRSLFLAVILCCTIGFFGATYAVLIAHGRSFLPPHLVGRGVTLLNFFGIGGVGLLQFASGRLHAGIAGGPAAPYAAIFALFAATLAAGIAAYAFSRGSADQAAPFPIPR